MTHTAKKDLSVIDLLRLGKLSELQKISINNPQMRAVLLQWRGLRQTAFFKRRMKFYKQFAKKTGLRKFTPEVKNQMRDEFARQQCLRMALQRAMQHCKKTLLSAPIIFRKPTPIMGRNKRGLFM